jgi:hypothetical protein
MPLLELYTEPLLTDSSLLDAYVTNLEPTRDSTRDSTLHHPNRNSHA